MNAFFTDPMTFKLCSLAGTGFALLGVLISGLAYRGKLGQRYSPLNHFISELGEVGISRLAVVFNIGLTLCGLCLVPASISLGLILPGFLSKIALGVGILTALSLALVGVFPMNNIKPHGQAAVTFFRAGLLMVLAFSLAIAFPISYPAPLSRLYALAGLPAILSFGTFLVLMGRQAKSADDALQPLDEQRPKVWRMAVSEWSIFVTIILWFVLIAVGL